MKQSLKANVITICGSTKFKDEYEKEAIRLTMEGNVVLGLSCYLTEEEKKKLSKEQADQLLQLHLQKIEMSNAIFVVNPGNYIGNTTMKEILYASKKGIPIQYLEEDE